MSENLFSRTNLAPDQLKSLIRELTAPRFTLKDTEIKNRNITHWSQEGLLIGDTRKGAWRRLSYVEVLWMRIIAHLRGFEIPLDMIRTVKKEICNDSILVWALYAHPDGRGPDLPAADTGRVSVLASLVIHAILYRRKPVIVVTRKDEVKSLYLDGTDSTEHFFARYDLLSTSFICVSLAEVMRDSFRKIDAGILSSDLQVLTPAEAEVITCLRTVDLKSVIVSQGTNPEVDLFQTAEAEGLDPVFLLLDLIWRKGYERITWAMKDGRVTYFDYPDRFKWTPEQPDGNSARP